MPHHIKPSIVANQLCDHPVLPRLCIHSALVTPIYWGKASDTALFFQFLFWNVYLRLGLRFLAVKSANHFAFALWHFVSFLLMLHYSNSMIHIEPQRKLGVD